MVAKSILLVDNNKNFLSALASRLRMDGYVVTEKDSVEGALEHLKNNQPNLVIIDKRLKKENNPKDDSGYELARQVNLPKIIITAEDPNIAAEILNIRGNGLPLAQGYVQKGPNVLPTLLLTIKNVLDATETAKHLIDTKEIIPQKFNLDVNKLLWNEYVDAQRTAKYNHRARLFLMVAGGILILIGCGLVFTGFLATIVMTITGAITSAIGGLFTKDFEENANKRRDDRYKDLLGLYTGQIVESNKPKNIE